jgi:hypothetical protein
MRCGTICRDVTASNNSGELMCGRSASASVSGPANCPRWPKCFATLLLRRALAGAAHGPGVRECACVVQWTLSPTPLHLSAALIPLSRPRNTLTLWRSSCSTSR